MSWTFTPASNAPVMISCVATDSHSVSYGSDSVVVNTVGPVSLTKANDDEAAQVPQDINISNGSVAKKNSAAQKPQAMNFSGDFVALVGSSEKVIVSGSMLCKKNSFFRTGRASCNGVMGTN